MAENLKHDVYQEDEEEYVLHDLDAVSGLVDIPPNTPYVLSGLDTLNPLLIIDDKVKLIGEYEETIGTCFVFFEDKAAPLFMKRLGHQKQTSSVENV